MLKRTLSQFIPYAGPVASESWQIEDYGHCLMRQVFGSEEVAALRQDVLRVYSEHAPDDRPGLEDSTTAEMFRYEMFNRSALCQKAMAHPRILEVLDPLLGHDCHVINSTAWRNPPGPAAGERESYFWHIDGGPHVPRPAGVAWPDAIPYPIFVIATHIYLEDCGLDEGPTSVIPTSHRSGRRPPTRHRFDESIDYEGHRPTSHIARAGDVSFFVSDVWHRRRLPTEASKGRFFLQTNYGRRDIAQRILPTERVNHVSDEARARAQTRRERRLIGLHDPAYYDG